MVYYIEFSCASVDAGWYVYWALTHAGFPFVLSSLDHVLCEPH